MKLLRASLIMMFLLNALMLCSQITQEWSQSYAFPTGINAGIAYCSPLIDQSGNIYVGGAEQNDSSMFLAKFDPNGNVLWKRYYNRPNSIGYQSVKYLAMDSNGDIIVCANDLTWTADFDVTLLKYDQQGNRLWQYTYSQANADHALDMAVDAQNNIYLLIAGNCGLSYPSPHTLLKLSASGILTQSNVIYVASSNYSGGDLILGAAGQIGFRISHWDSANVFRNLIFVCDSAFNIVWSRTFANYGIFTMAMDSVGNVTAVGNTNSINYSGILRIEKFDTSGNTVWSRTTGVFGAYVFAYDMLIDPNGDYYFAVNQSNYPNPANGYVTKFSASGVMVWYYQIINPYGPEEYCQNLRFLNGNTLLAKTLRVVGGPQQWWNIYDQLEIDTTGSVLSLASYAYPYQQGQVAVTPTAEFIPTGELVTVSMFPNSGQFELTKFCRGGVCVENVNGVVFMDDDGNCSIDSGEAGVPGRIVTINGGQYYAMSDTAGEFSLSLGQGNFIMDESLPLYWMETCPAPIAINLTNAQDSSYGNKFGNQVIPNVTDVGVNSFTTSATPGTQQYHILHYENNGTISANGSFTLDLDPIFNFVSADIPPDTVSGNHLAWNFSSLLPLQGNNIAVLTTITTSTSVNSFYGNIATIIPSASDFNGTDNTYRDSGIVTGSYDPNRKNVWPRGTIDYSDSILTYTIFFQNTGTDTALNIYILDTLSWMLDLSTFHIVTASHYMIPSLQGERTIRFSFPNVMLPDSGTNEALSHGYVRYTIRQGHWLPPLTVIRNTAQIYFDFNEAVTTNTVSDTLSSMPGIAESSVSTITVFPVPATHQVVIKTPGYESEILISIFDATGRMVLEQTSQQIADGTTVTLTDLASGCYYLRIIGNNYNASLVLPVLRE